MNRIFSNLFIFISFVSFPLSAAAQKQSAQEAYIEKYAQMAVDEMFRSGVPASITLAQGMLESANGQSYLATKGNNHFGIKCHDWKGPGVYIDAEKRNECFRKYKSVSDSYKDHSDFLRYRDRYKPLFDLKTTDYKGWAHGLKRAGYATDPSYPRKLISIIETYGLSRFDQTDAKAIRRQNRLARKEARRLRKKTAAVPVAAGDTTAVGVAMKEERPETITVAPGSRIPESPTVLEEPRLYEGSDSEFRFSLSRHLYSQNGVAFVYSAEGETYASIAKLYSLFPREILYFNDVRSDKELLPGTIVYLQPKKKKAASHLDKYIAEGNETLADISQRFAVRLNSIMKLNGFTEDHILKEGDTVLLR